MYGVALFDRTFISRKDWGWRQAEGVTPYAQDVGSTILLIVFIAVMAGALIGYYWVAPRAVDFERVGDVLPLRPDTNTMLLRLAGGGYLLIGIIAFVAILWEPLSGNPLLVFTTDTPRSQLFAGATH